MADRATTRLDMAKYIAKHKDGIYDWQWDSMPFSEQVKYLTIADYALDFGVWYGMIHHFK